MLKPLLLCWKGSAVGAALTLTGRVSRVLPALVLVFAGWVHAESEPAVAAEDQVAAVDENPAFAASRVVESITEDLIELIEQAQTYFDEDEPRFYRELGETLEKYVDFRSFSRAVMGRYAGRKALAEMNEAGQEKLQAQIERFNSVFSAALIDTYGKGLLVFEGRELKSFPHHRRQPRKREQGRLW